MVSCRPHALKSGVATGSVRRAIRPMLKTRCIAEQGIFALAFDNEFAAGGGEFQQWNRNGNRSEWGKRAYLTRSGVRRTAVNSCLAARYAQPLGTARIRMGAGDGEEFAACVSRATGGVAALKLNGPHVFIGQRRGALVCHSRRLKHPSQT